MGDSLPVTTMSPFHIIRADDTTMAKFKTWYNNWRQFRRLMSSKQLKPNKLASMTELEKTHLTMLIHVFEVPHSCYFDSMCFHLGALFQYTNWKTLQQLELQWVEF